jgi:quinoprotein glucose dehydrogenase
MSRVLPVTLIGVVLVSLVSSATPPGDWPIVSGDAGGSKYSALGQINRANVATLNEAWRFSTGEPTTPLPGRSKAPAFEATPIVIDGVMYFGTPYGQVFALDAVTGAKKWNYDAQITRSADYGDFANRGVSTWRDPRVHDGTKTDNTIVVFALP